MAEFTVTKKVDTIYDLVDPNQLAVLRAYLDYLQILQAGRVKPDRSGKHSIVWDSLDNVPDIEAVKRKISRMLNLDQEMIDSFKEDIENSKKSKDERYRGY